MAAGAFCGIAALAIIAAAPEVGLLLTVASIPLEEMGAIGQVGDLRISLAKVFAALTVLVWAGGVVVLGRRVWVPKMAWIFGLYVAAGGISLVGAPDLGAGISMLHRLLLTFIFFLLVANLLDTWPKLMRALAAFSAVTVIVSGFAVSQQFLEGFTYGQRTVEVQEEIQYGAQVDIVEQEMLGRSVLRSGGTSWHPIVLGFNAVLMMPIFAWGAFQSRRGWLRLICAGGFLIHVAALVSSGSRSCFIAFVGVLFLLVLKRIIPLNRYTIGGSIVAALIAWPILPEDYKARVLNPGAYQAETSQSLYYRFDMLNAGIEVFRRHPFTGIGLGNVTEMNNYMTEWDFQGHDMGVHNMYVQVALETGIVGLAACLFLYVYILRGFSMAARVWQAAGDPWRAALCRALSVCVWAILLQGLSLDMMGISMRNAWFLVSLQPVLLYLAARHAEVVAAPVPERR